MAPRKKVKPGKFIRSEIKNIPRGYLMCRTYRHAWKLYDARENRNNPAKRYVQELVCTRCNTFRAIFMDEEARIKGGAYFYPEGYVLDGIGHLTAGERAYIRLMTMDKI